MVSVQLVVAVMVIAPRLATGSSPDWNCAWSSISWRSNRSRQSIAPTCPCRAGRRDTMGLQHVGARARQPDRQLHRGRQVRAGRHHQRSGVFRGLHGAGAHHADAHRSGGAVDRVEVGVVAGAVQRDAGERLDAESLNTCEVQLRQDRSFLGASIGGWTVRLVLGRLALRAGAGVGGIARIGGQEGRASGQQSRQNDGRGAQARTRRRRRMRTTVLMSAYAFLT